MRLRQLSILLTTVSIGCTQIPPTPPYAPTMGAKTCTDLANAAANRSTEEFLAGTALIVAGVTGVTAGVLWGPDTAPEAAWPEQNRHLLTIAPSAVAGVLGIATVARWRKTELLANETWTILSERKNEADRYLYYECVSARADWSGNSSELRRVQVDFLKHNLAAAAAAEQAAADSDTHAHVATSLASDAKTVAAQASQVASASAEATNGLVTVTEKMIEAASKKEDDTKIRDAKATLSGVKGNLAPKPAGVPPRVQGSPPAPLEKQR